MIAIPQSVMELVDVLAVMRGVVAVVLGGSRAVESEDEPAKFRSPEEIEAACKEVGIGKDDTVYVYCFKGARASNSFVALNEAGFNDKVHDLSDTEWDTFYNYMNKVL